MLDLSFVRAAFPALDGDWALLDNAGGTVPVRGAIERAADHLRRRCVQIGATYPHSEEAARAVREGRRSAALLVGASEDEVALGPSATQCARTVAGALRPRWREGDEVVVTNLDHEANVGPWRRMAATGIRVREWRFRPETMALEPEDLLPLLSERTRLVAFTHCSNLVGTIHDVPRIAALVREAGALSCVDGVAFAPHRRVDVRALGTDLYLASLYKTWGPHLGLLHVRRDLLEALPSQNHFFVDGGTPAQRLEPGGVCHELVAALPGIPEHLLAVDAHHGGDASAPVGVRLERAYALFAAHEAALLGPLLACLGNRPDVRLLGSTDAGSPRRTPTVSFAIAGVPSSEVPRRLEVAKVAIRHGHFYAYRAVQDLGLLAGGGVVRASLAHYTAPEEVERLVRGLDGVRAS